MRRGLVLTDGQPYHLEPVRAIDISADEGRKQNGGDLAAQRINGHGKQGPWIDGRQVEDGAEFEDARVPC